MEAVRSIRLAHENKLTQIMISVRERFFFLKILISKNENEMIIITFGFGCCYEKNRFIK